MINEFRIEMTPGNANGWIKVENYSELSLCISLIPKKPKRKYLDIFVVPPNGFLLIPNEKEDIIDLKSLSFSWRPDHD